MLTEAARAALHPWAVCGADAPPPPPLPWQPHPSKLDGCAVVGVDNLGCWLVVGLAVCRGQLHILQ